MEQIDAQVSDLRYLSQSQAQSQSQSQPPPPPPQQSHHQQQHNLPHSVTSTPGSGGHGSAYDLTNASPSPGSASIGDNSAHHHHHLHQQHQQQQQQHQQHQSNTSGAVTPAAGGASGPGSASGNKRRAEDDASSKQTRSKRNRYISIACNECKRRKIKCNGETPCQRCGNLNLQCLYAPNCCSSSFKDSDEYKHVASQIQRLQDDVGYLNNAMRTLQDDSARAAANASNQTMANNAAGQQHRGTNSSTTVTPSPSQTSMSLHRSQDHPGGRRTGFRGPTSAAFSLNVANTTIANMGYKPISDGTGDDPNPHAHDYHLHPDEHNIMSTTSGMPAELLPLDPILEYDQDELVRLIRVHEAEVGIMFPIIDTVSAMSHAKSLSSFLQGIKDRRYLHAINDIKTLELKIVLCLAHVVEENGHSLRATRLYESMENVLNRMLMADDTNIATLPLLALLAGYRNLSNDEVLGWRVIGQVTRLCMEMGIHQRMGLMKIENEQERKMALNAFWTAYVLDRRWAFGTGLPYVVQDEEIDPQLPLPEEYPYMVAMITYSRLGAKVWRQVSYFEPVLARELRQEEIERLDEEIMEWYETVPEDVKVRNWDKERHMASTPSYNLQRLRIWTYLRFNQIRIWLYTPILHSATSIMSHPQQAQRVVDLARDTIRYLSHLNSTTTLYHTMQVFYHQFLTSAISVVFLASVHAPVRFSAVCREEFYLALELVRDLSARSTVSKRLWQTIKTLKDVAPKFGLNPDDDPHSTAALGMIGLARGGPEQDDEGAIEGGGRPPPVNRTPLGSNNTNSHNGGNNGGNDGMIDGNGSRIQSEMSRIYEGYVSLNGFQSEQGEQNHNPSSSGRQGGMPSINTGGPGGNGAGNGSGNGNGGVYGADGTVYPHFRGMF